ncbi:MAG: metallophosphoesterase family protein [Cyclobacteriaceae bacterium]
MIHSLKYSVILLLFFITGCKGTLEKNTSPQHANDIVEVNIKEPLEFAISGLHAENDSILLRVAILGDAEPKPLAEFPNMDSAVEQINALSEEFTIDFVIGVGDIAHNGTEIQYEAATQVLQKLKAPFYSIMGNEEHSSTVERYLQYAQKWNSKITSPSYVINHDKLAIVFASPDHGRDFNDNGAQWILDQIQRLNPKPIVLVVHGAQKGVFPENSEKGISNELFVEQVVSQPNLVAVISGDLHMDMDRANHSKKIDHVHYLHIPALERTKTPDETNHTPMFRIMTFFKDDKVTVDTYAVGDYIPRKEHAYTFSLSISE